MAADGTLGLGAEKIEKRKFIPCLGDQCSGGKGKKSMRIACDEEFLPLLP